jgi:hypothetical protein
MLTCFLLVSSLVQAQPAPTPAPRPTPVAALRSLVSELSDGRSLANGSLTDAAGRALQQLHAEQSSSLTHR